MTEFSWVVKNSWLLSGFSFGLFEAIFWYYNAQDIFKGNIISIIAFCISCVCFALFINFAAIYVSYLIKSTKDIPEL